MEYVFLLVLAVSVCMYLADRKGWNATAKRLSTMARAHIESTKPIPALEPVKDHDDWEQKFKEIENPQAINPVNIRHALARTSYYDTNHYGQWPQWHCKCGAKGYEPTGSYSNGMESAKRRAKAAAEEHIRTAIAAEEMQAKTGGKFSW